MIALCCYCLCRCTSRSDSGRRRLVRTCKDLYGFLRNVSASAVKSYIICRADRDAGRKSMTLRKELNNDFPN